MKSLQEIVELQKKRMGVHDIEEARPLEQIIQELQEDSKKYREESKKHYKQMHEQLNEIKGLVKYTLSEQEKQRISQMSTAELLVDIQKNVEDMKVSLDKVLDKDSKLVKDNDNVDWASYAELVYSGSDNNERN